MDRFVTCVYFGTWKGPFFLSFFRNNLHLGTTGLEHLFEQFQVHCGPLLGCFDFDFQN